MESLAGLFYTTCEDWTQAKTDALLDRLPAATAALLRQAVQPAVLRQRLAGRLLLAHWLGDSADLAYLQYTEQGKPYLPDHAPFSIAHSHQLALLAWGAAVDAEYKGRRIRVEHFTDYLHPDEQKALLHSPLPEQRILQWWTKKEALAKWLGIGLSLPFREISVLEDAVFWQGKSFFFQCHSQLHSDYWVHTCSEQEQAALSSIALSF